MSKAGLATRPVALVGIMLKKKWSKTPTQGIFSEGGTNETSAKTRNVGPPKYPAPTATSNCYFWFLVDQWCGEIWSCLFPQHSRLQDQHAACGSGLPRTGTDDSRLQKTGLDPNRYVHTGRQICDLAWHWKPSEIIRTNHIHHGDANLITELVGVISIQPNNNTRQVWKESESPMMMKSWTVYILRGGSNEISAERGMWVH